MASLEEQVCDAIEILANNSVTNAEYDKTIQATILRCEDKSVGKYLVKYQDSKFYAYSTGVDVTYPVDTLVYILVPNGDFSKDKTIIGSTVKSGSNYVTTLEDAAKYNLIGENVFTNADYAFNMSSYVSERYYKLYDYTDTENSLINVDWVDTYIKNAGYVKFGATI